MASAHTDALRGPALRPRPVFNLRRFTEREGVFSWLMVIPPVVPDPEPDPRPRRPDDVPIYVPPSPLPSSGQAGRTTLARGAPASEVIGPLQAFLDAHRDEQVIVEWRVQE